MNSQAIPDLQPRHTGNRIISILTKIMSGIGVLLGGMWAIITYLIPDPSVFGFSFINWRNVVVFVSLFCFIGAMSISWQIRNLPTLLRGTLHTLLIAALACGFFALGTEYAKPSFEFAKAQSKITENESANLLGKRMEAVDGIRIELIGCESIGRLPTCTLELTNLDLDRDFQFSNGSSLFDEEGGPIQPNTIRVGQMENSFWNRFQLLHNVPTRITLTFQQARNKLEHSPALKLVFQDRNFDTQVLKFNDVAFK